MAYRIEKKGSFVEVNLGGQTSRWELLQIVHQLHIDDPRKELHDLWIVSETSGVFLDEFPEMVRSIARLCSPDMAFSKTALVAPDEFVRSQLVLYKMEASALPFEIEVFTEREDALRWFES